MSSLPNIDLLTPPTRPSTALTPIGAPAIGAGPIVLDAIPNPFSNEIVTIRGPEGSTIAELLAIAGIRWRRYGGGLCWIEDAERRFEPVPVPWEIWHRVRPKAGTVTTVKLMPGRGGSGSGSGKSILRIVLSLAVVAAAFLAGPQIAVALGPTLGLTGAGITAFGAVISSVICVVGNLVINAPIPPPVPRSPERIETRPGDES